MVEQQNLDLATVVGVDDAGARVDEVLRSETRARGDAAVFCRRVSAPISQIVFVFVFFSPHHHELTGSGGHSHANVGVDQRLASGRNGRVLGRVNVVAGSKGATPRGQTALVGELLDLESRRSSGVIHCSDGGVFCGGLDALGGRRVDCGVVGFGGCGHVFCFRGWVFYCMLEEVVGLYRLNESVRYRQDKTKGLYT